MTRNTGANAQEINSMEADDSMEAYQIQFGSDGVDIICRLVIDNKNVELSRISNTFFPDIDSEPCRLWREFMLSLMSQYFEEKTGHPVVLRSNASDN